MSIDDPRPSDSDRPLTKALHAYFLAVDAGQRPDQSALLKQHPDLADELAAFFADQDKLDEVARAMKPEPSPAEAPTLDASNKPAVGTFGKVRYFGDYELLEEIARGGMGVVFKARQVSLNRVVALKMILAGQLASEADVQRFHAEAEAAANLDHPNIVPIYEVGEHDGQHYFSMKFIDGGSLLQGVRGEGSGVSQESQRAAAQLIATVARAVHHAHQRGILHRDLKPGNILLSFSRRSQSGADTPPPALVRDERLNDAVPHITDFGLAKRVTADTGQTRTGAIVGTPSYMAPEQARGVKALTTAADVYSLGAILYELLTGRPPFKAETPLETLRQVTDDEPTRPRSLDGQINRDLETICLKCLEKEPARRYDAAAALADDLERWLCGEPIVARRSSAWERTVYWVKRRPVLFALIDFGALTAAIIAGLTLLHNWQLRRHLADTNAALDRETEAKSEAKRQELLARRYFYGSDINLAQQALESGNGVRLISALERQIPKPGEEDQRTFEWHYLWRQARTERMTLRGHTEQISILQYSRDGKSLISAAKDEVKVWDTETGALRKEFSVAPGKISCMAFAPDGNTVALGFERAQKETPGPLVQTWDIESGRKLADLKPGIGNVRAVAFDPESDTMTMVVGDEDADFTGSGVTGFFRRMGAGGLRVWKWDMKTNQGVSTTLGVTGWGFVIPFDIALSDDAKTLVACGNGAKIAAAFSFDFDKITSETQGLVLGWDVATGHSKKVLTGHSMLVLKVAVSPDSRTVASFGADLRIKQRDIDTGAETAPTLGPFRPSLVFIKGGSPMCFSPDGRHLAVSGDPGTVGLWDVRTGRQVAALFGHTTSVEQMRFSPDGRFLAASGTDHTIKQWDLSASQEPLPVTLGAHEAQKTFARFLSTGVIGPLFLPRGDKFVVAKDNDVLLFDATTGKEVDRFRAFEPVPVLDAPPIPGMKMPMSNPDISEMAISPDGTLLATTSGDALKLWDVSVDPPESSVRMYADIAYPLPFSSIAFSPDGRFLITGDAVWDVGTWEKRTEQAVEGLTKVRAFSANGKRYVSVYDEPPRVTVRELADGALCFERISKPGPEKCALSPTGDTLALGFQDGTLETWNVGLGTQSFNLRGHTSFLGLTFAPDGRTLAIASADGTVKLYDPVTGQERVTLHQDGYSPSQISFAPSGTTLGVTWVPMDVLGREKAPMLLLYRAGAAKPTK